MQRVAFLVGTVPLILVFSLIFPLGSAFARGFGVEDPNGEIRRFNSNVARDRPDLFEGKRQAMAADPFSFLRGTAHLMYADIQKTADLAFLKNSPSGLLAGDAHIHNFSTLYFTGKKPSYGLTDLDEAHDGPLGFDVFRMAVSLAVAFQDTLDKKERTGALESALDGYAEGLKQEASPDWPECSFPGFLKEFLDACVKKDPEKNLKKWTAQSNPNRFVLAKAGFVKLPGDEEEGLKKVLSPYLSRQCRNHNLPMGFSLILDMMGVEEKGLSSLGLKRYYVLIQGKSPDWRDGRVIEVKEMRPSSVGPGSLVQQARDTLRGFQAAHRDRDVFLGTFPLGEKMFLVRELFPWDLRMEYSMVKGSKVDEFARALGAILADFHSGNPGKGKMLSWVQANREDLLHIARKYAKQVQADWEEFRQSRQK